MQQRVRCLVEATAIDRGVVALGELHGFEHAPCSNSRPAPNRPERNALALQRAPSGRGSVVGNHELQSIGVEAGEHSEFFSLLACVPIDGVSCRERHVRFAGEKSVEVLGGAARRQHGDSFDRLFGQVFHDAPQLLSQNTVSPSLGRGRDGEPGGLGAQQNPYQNNGDDHRQQRNKCLMASYELHDLVLSSMGSKIAREAFTSWWASNPVKPAGDQNQLRDATPDSTTTRFVSNRG